MTKIQKNACWIEPQPETPYLISFIASIVP